MDDGIANLTFFIALYSLPSFRNGGCCSCRQLNSSEQLALLRLIFQALLGQTTLVLWQYFPEIQGFPLCWWELFSLQYYWNLFVSIGGILPQASVTWHSSVDARGYLYRFLETFYGTAASFLVLCLASTSACLHHF